MAGLYVHMRKVEGASPARTLARKTLEEARNNVTQAAKRLGCSRKTIRRAREGPPEDISRAPHRYRCRIRPDWEELICAERAKVHYGKRRMSKYLTMKYGIVVSENTIQSVYHRNPITKNTYKRPATSKPLYDYEHLRPFEKNQTDTKHLEDYQALGPLCFHLRHHHLPLYQWTFICAKTKVRFCAYSYTLSSTFGFLYISLIGAWLRAHGIHTTLDGGWTITAQGDNGIADFCAGSKQKEEEWNRLLHVPHLDMHFKSIPAGKKYLQGIVERSHRTDDEEFLRPHLEKIADVRQFLCKAQDWQDAYNKRRMHFGKGMNGMTPFQKLQDCHILNADRICSFPVFLMEDVISVLGSGTYVSTQYQV